MVIIVSKVSELLKSTKRERQFVECTPLGGVICPLIRMKNYDTYLYGVGIEADVYISFFMNEGIEVKGIIDRDVEKKGKFVFEVPYIHTSDLNYGVIDNPSNSIALVVTDASVGLQQFQILQCLIEAGFSKIYHLTSFDKKQVTGIIVPDIKGKSLYFRNNIEGIEKTYEMLYDEKSKKIMLEYLRTYTESGMYRLEQNATRNKYFFDGLTVNDRTEIYSHLEDEVWVNCGASVGDSLFIYFDNGLKAKKVFAFEGDKQEYKKLCTSLSLLPEEHREKVIAIEEYISQDTSFEEYIDEKITLLNADIQGNELKMLQAMKTKIIEDRPVIAICVYHKPEDLKEIPQYIDTLVDDYKYILRKYAADAYDSTQGWELVLYAVPDERCVI